jgi:ADP-ribose pyrophosphatase YjhB (NUDIX family)
MNFLSGAGIFIIENFDNHQVALLFGMKNGEYNEPGGTIDPGEKPEVTACRETREETANIINIKPDELLKIAIPIQHKQYMSYVIYLDKINTNDYYHNVKIIFNKCRPHVWKENNSIARINLNELIQNSHDNKNIMKDINGKNIFIRNRTLGIAKKINNILNNLKKPITLYQNITLHSRLSCLIGTFTYTYKEHAKIIDKKRLRDILKINF